MKAMNTPERKLSERMYNLNANLSALVHIQKLKSLPEAENYMRLINREIGNWIKIVREMEENEKRSKEE